MLGSHSLIKLGILLFALYFAKVQSACFGNDIPCDNGECYYYWFQCDTEFDCQDGSDEQNCAVNTVDSCGGKINETAPSGYISTPNYPSDYPYDALCTWIIQGPPESKITLRFDDFNLQNPRTEIKCSQGNCDTRRICSDWLSIYELKSGGARIFCDDDYIEPYESTGNYLWLQFRSDNSQSYSGFKIEYSFSIGSGLRSTSVIIIGSVLGSVTLLFAVLQ